MTRLTTFGAAMATAALLIGCVPVDPAPTSTTSAPPTTSDAACQIQARTIATALEAYKAAGPDGTGGDGVYPDSLADLAFWLEDLPGPEWVYTSDGASYSLTGPC